MLKCAKTLLLVGVTLTGTGCSVTYYDKATQTQHVFGLSHIKMKLPNSDDGQAVIHQVKTLGAATGNLREGGHLSIGYSESTILDISDNQELCFTWPSSSLLDIKINEPTLTNGICNHVPVQPIQKD